MPSLASILMTAGALAAVASAACGGGAAERQIHVVGAASMRGVLDELADVWERSHPGARVLVRTGGSTALSRMVLELDLRADLLVLADAGLFEDLLIPEWTTFYARAARDSVVLAYTDDSIGAEVVGPDTWPDVVLRDDVGIAIADPDRAPVGYRTLLVLKLAQEALPGVDLQERVWQKAQGRNLRPDVAELLAPLEAGACDYAFLYRATAVAAGLRYVDLGAAVDLGDPSRAEEYARVEVTIRGRTPDETLVKRGAPIVYGASVPTDARRADAIGMLALLLSDDGAAILERHGFAPSPRDGRLVGRVPSAVGARLGQDRGDSGR